MNMKKERVEFSILSMVYSSGKRKQRGARVDLFLITRSDELL